MVVQQSMVVVWPRCVCVCVCVMWQLITERPPSENRYVHVCVCVCVCVAMYDRCVAVDGWCAVYVQLVCVCLRCDITAAYGFVVL